MKSFSTINIDEIVAPALAREGSGAAVGIDDDRYVHANVLTLGLGYTLGAFLGRRLPIWHLQTPRGSGLSWPRVWVGALPQDLIVFCNSISMELPRPLQALLRVTSPTPFPS